jgi:hypothetical protein
MHLCRKSSVVNACLQQTIWQAQYLSLLAIHLVHCSVRCQSVPSLVFSRSQPLEQGLGLLADCTGRETQLAHGQEPGVVLKPGDFGKSLMMRWLGAKRCVASTCVPPVRAP